MIDYTLVRTRRKTVAIYVRAGGAVEVRAPLRTPAADIERFVARKSDWITRMTARQTQKAAGRTAFSPGYGGAILLWGDPVTLACGADAKRTQLSCDTLLLPPGLDSAGIKRACVAFYKEQARAVLPIRTAEYARIMGVTPANIKVSSARTRWGSCSSKGNINFSWHLAMARPAAADYIIVHELAHLREPNHAPRFWTIVGGVLPDYIERRAELRELQKRLSGEDWETHQFMA